MLRLPGGEPLVHTDSAELVSKLTEIGCDVNIETNGAVDIVDFLGKVPKSDNLFFTIDYKLPSSGMTDKRFGIILLIYGLAMLSNSL